VRGETLDETGILVDFRQLRRAVSGAVDELDHADLNKLDAFAAENPTSEHIARHLFRRLSAMLNTDRCRSSRVSVQETPGSLASYWE
jgi:6-pyruvoyltetrahydropterin/6-carboxytetrahydropterin synthase